MRSAGRDGPPQRPAARSGTVRIARPRRQRRRRARRAHRHHQGGGEAVALWAEGIAVFEQAIHYVAEFLVVASVLTMRATSARPINGCTWLKLSPETRRMKACAQRGESGSHRRFAFASICSHIARFHPSCKLCFARLIRRRSRKTSRFVLFWRNGRVLGEEIAGTHLQLIFNIKNVPQ